VDKAFGLPRGDGSRELARADGDELRTGISPTMVREDRGRQPPTDPAAPVDHGDLVTGMDKRVRSGEARDARANDSYLHCLDRGRWLSVLPAHGGPRARTSTTPGMCSCGVWRMPPAQASLASCFVAAQPAVVSTLSPERVRSLV
jgi:hypothetical protein